MNTNITEMALSGDIEKDAEKCYNYAKNVVKGKVPEHLERVIAKSSMWSHMYAKFVLNRERFELGEPAIAKKAEWSYKYAIFVIGGRFELGEPAIKKDSYYWTMYKKRFNIQESQEHEHPKKPLIYQCSWCKKYLINDEWVVAEINPEDYQVSHGVCPTCAKKLRKDWNLDG